MKKTLLLILFSVCFGVFSQAQDIVKYNELVAEASRLYDAGDFLHSAQKYADAFVALGNKGTADDRYNAACSWALANEADSAFVQLLKIARDANYTNYDQLNEDPDLKSLYSDPRWEKVKMLVKINKEKTEMHYDKPLVALLDSIFNEDQQYRHQIDEIEQKYGWESEQIKNHLKMMDEKDSLNQIVVQKILDERGWLGPDIIGQTGNTTLFLVIQHADLPVQEKYLPMMREAVKKGNAKAGNLALLEDRVALRQGKKQIYGSQIGVNPVTGENFVSPLEDPDNVDKRRAEVGLEPLQAYIAYWGMTWDVELYKKQLEEMERKLRE